MVETYKVSSGLFPCLVPSTRALPGFSPVQPSHSIVHLEAILSVLFNLLTQLYIWMLFWSFTLQSYDIPHSHGTGT